MGRTRTRTLFGLILVGAVAAALCAATSPAVADPSWTWSDTYITGGDYSALSFASATSGWACGSSGGVARTTDGGETWTRVRTAWDDTLTDIAAISATEAWACGWRWAEAPAMQPFALHTQDGGETWTESDLPTGEYTTASEIAAADATHIWVVVAGTLYATADGTTWAAQSDPAQVSRLFFLDADHGWALASSDSGICDTICRTVDGGAHWQAVTAVAPYDSNHDVVFTDASHGLVVGEYGGVMATTDGGVTWADVGSVADASSTMYTEGGILSAVDAQHAWVATGSGDVYATDDGGHSWFSQYRTYMWGPGSMDIVVKGESGWTTGARVLRTGHNGLPDMRPPVTTYSAPEFINAPVSVQLTATDSGGGVAGTWYRLGFGAWQEGDEIQLSALTSDSGQHTVEVSSVDAYGNWEHGNTFEYTVDVTGPVVTWAPDTDVMMDHWTNRGSRIVLSADDGGYGCGATAVQVKLGRADWVDRPVLSVVTTGAPLNHKNDGAHTIMARGVDKLNNLGVETTHTVAIDTRPPSASAPSTCYARSRATGTIRFKISDVTPCYGACAPRIVVKTLKGRKLGYIQPSKWLKENTTVAVRFGCPLKAGKYKFSVTAGDGAGNVTPKAASNFLIVRAGSKSAAAEGTGAAAMGATPSLFSPMAIGGAPGIRRLAPVTR